MAATGPGQHFFGNLDICFDNDNDMSTLAGAAKWATGTVGLVYMSYVSSAWNPENLVKPGEFTRFYGIL